MKLLAGVKRVCRYVEEDEKFWTEHLLKFSESGLCGSAYCRANGVNRYRFHYWKKALGKKGSGLLLTKESALPKLNSLLRVEVKEEKSKEVAILCSVELVNGLVLRIHEWSVVQQILSKVV